MKKRTLAVLLTLLLVISMVPMAAMAEDVCECGDSRSYAYTYMGGNDDGTHTYYCGDCDKFVETENCTYGADGCCVNCSYDPNADHNHWDYVEYEPNGDGTHAATCKYDNCGKDLGTYSCEYNNEDICDYCLGAKPENPVTGLDNVPKTGDNGSLIAVTSLSVLAMFAAAFYITDKKRAF